jgi:hypothetical protein
MVGAIYRPRNRGLKEQKMCDTQIPNHPSRSNAGDVTVRLKSDVIDAIDEALHPSSSPANALACLERLSRIVHDAQAADPFDYYDPPPTSRGHYDDAGRYVDDTDYSLFIGTIN